MNSPSKVQERPTNDEKVTMYIQDDENTMMFKPIDMNMNRFFGTWSKLLTLPSLLNTEVRDKHDL